MKVPRLREWRERRGLRQEDLGSMAGVDRRNVSLWETGRGGIRPTTARKVAVALGVSIDDLVAPLPTAVTGDPKAEAWTGPGSLEAMSLDPKMAPLQEDDEAFERRVSAIQNSDTAEAALAALGHAAVRAKKLRESAYNYRFSSWATTAEQAVADQDIAELDRLYARFGPRFGKLWRLREEFIASEVEGLDPEQALERLDAAKRDRT